MVADGRGHEQRGDVTIIDVGRRPAGRLGRMLRLPWVALRAIRALSPAIVHFHDPELLPLGWALSRRGMKVIYDVHEDVPQQILAKYWLPRALRPVVSSLFARFESHVAGRLRAVVVANPPTLPRFLALGCDAVCVNNFPLLEEFPSPGPGTRERNVIAYVGGLTRVRGVVQLVQALALLSDVRLLLCGRFADDGSEAACRALPGWARVEYLGHVDRPTIQSVLSRAEVGMVTLLPEPNYLVALPVKMFEYMAAAVPAVASDTPLYKEIVEANQCGLCVDPTAPEAIAAAVRAVLCSPDKQAMGQRGRDAVLHHYNWQRESIKLLALYARISAVDGAAQARTAQ